MNSDTQANRIDRAGTVVSAACAVHCGATALAPSLLSALGLGVLLGEEGEWAFTLVAMVLASVGAFLGFRKHRDWAVGAVFAVGLLGLLGSRLLEEAGGHETGTIVGILAASLLITGHVLNLRRARMTG